jgi:hypothetical protein
LGLIIPNAFDVQSKEIAKEDKISKRRIITVCHIAAPAKLQSTMSRNMCENSYLYPLPIDLIVM